MGLCVWHLFLVGFFLRVASSLDVSTLRLVTILFRHGDRTADGTYPNSPYQEDYWPNGFAQLTTTGMQQEYELGQYFRNRYNGYLNSTYVRYELSVHSTYKDRTVMSAQAVLAGLYPPHGQQVWNENIPWQPITVRTDYNFPVIDMDVQCDKYYDMYGELVAGPKGQKLYEDNKELIDYMMVKGGYETNSLSEILGHAWDMYDPLYVENLYRIAPEWLTPDMLAKMKDLRTTKYDFWFGNDEMTYLKAGLFMHMISNNTQTRMDGTMAERMKLFLWSAHDSTVVCMMKALGVWDHQPPPYSTALIFELHQRPNGAYFMKLLHKNDSVDNILEGEPHQLAIPGCTLECPADKFLQLIEPMVMNKDFEEECENIEGWFGSASSIAVIACSVAVVVLIGIVICCCCNKCGCRCCSNGGYQRL